MLVCSPPMKSRISWLVMHSIHLSHTSALLIMLLTQTAGYKMAPFGVLLLQLLPYSSMNRKYICSSFSLNFCSNKRDKKLSEKLPYIYVFSIPFLLIGPAVLLSFTSPLT